MPKEESGIVLLSIKPQYVQAILAGRKKVEFRKKRFARPVKTVLIYATSPIKKIVAHFQIGQIDEGSPEELWRQYHSVGGIASEAYWSYFKNTKTAVAINITELNALVRPLNLCEVVGTNVPPQSYSYLENDALELLPTLSYAT
jgi:predicted transcriptional regulator